ncbi:MAG: sigma-70 family RNA polymerase sigma factor [Myxococcales bacterium]|nr:sigma-70 family RNA polymerase sigma factor [Myxococcales bacterium]MCB9532658.1 sigma-70 family RNA polymerase sigma factor [Myxococcales bacterium]
MFGRKPRQSDLRRRFDSEAMVHADALFGAALRLTKSRRDAEDLLQDTLLKAFQHFDRYEPGTNCKAWLFRILTNTFINRYRKSQRERVFLLDDPDTKPLAERAVARELTDFDGPVGTDEESIARLFGDEIGAALQRVPVDFRVAVLLTDVYDFSYKEVAEMLEVPIGTVMSRLYRGRRLLRAQLAEYAVERGAVREIGADYNDQIAEDRAKTIDLAAYRAARA